MTKAEQAKIKWYQKQIADVQDDISKDINLDNLGDPWPRLAAVESALFMALIRIDRLEKELAG